MAQRGARMVGLLLITSTDVLSSVTKSNLHVSDAGKRAENVLATKSLALLTRVPLFEHYTIRMTKANDQSIQDQSHRQRLLPAVDLSILHLSSISIIDSLPRVALVPCCKTVDRVRTLKGLFWSPFCPQRQTSPSYSHYSSPQLGRRTLSTW